MDANRSKRNLIALLIAAPIIFVASQLISWLGSDSIFFWPGIGNESSSNADEIDTHGDKLVRVESLRGQWFFAAGDDASRSREDFDHSSWAQVDVPANWESEGYKHHDGYGWYRRHFKIAVEDLDKPLYAVLGKIDDVDEVFINGQKVGGLGSFPPSYSGAWDKTRKYSLPKDLLHEGDNLIAVRVYDAQQAGGIYDGNIGIYASTLPPLLVNLEGAWQFTTNKEQKEYQSIRVPGAWEDQGYKDYDGMAWYKKDFPSLDVTTDQTLVLLLGKIDDTDEVTLNGHIIGRTGNLENKDQQTNPKYHLVKRVYEFSASLLEENNTLEVRVHDSWGIGGIYEGPVAIMTKTAHLQYVEKMARSD